MLYPVYPHEDKDSEDYGYFVSEDVYTSWGVVYHDNDPLGRVGHLSNFLKPGSDIKNYYKLCTPVNNTMTGRERLDETTLGINALLISINVNGVQTLVSYDTSDLTSEITLKRHSLDPSKVSVCCLIHNFDSEVLTPDLPEFSFSIAISATLNSINNNLVLDQPIVHVHDSKEVVSLTVLGCSFTIEYF